MKDFIILIIVFLFLDLLWVNYVMKNIYIKTFNEILKKNIEIKYIPAILAYIILISGLYYFTIKDKKENTMLNSALFGFVIYGLYDATIYSFLPIDNYSTGIIDVLWGTVVSGLSSYIVYKLK